MKDAGRKSNKRREPSTVYQTQTVVNSRLRDDPRRSPNESDDISFSLMPFKHKDQGDRSPPT